MGRFNLFLALFIFSIYGIGRSTIIDIPGDYPTIQQGIDASVSGDTVLVAEGTYYERVDFSGKAILLASGFIYSGDTLQIQNTIIDADTSIIGVDNMGSVVCFVSGEDSLSILRGFTITNGIGSLLNIYHRMGGGIFCMGNSSPRILDNYITGNYAAFGGGLYMLGNSNPAVRDNIIDNNTGGGIYFNGSSPEISRNVIRRNNADRGGGVRCDNSPTAVISDNLIYENDGGLWGGGIFCYQSNPVIIGNIIYDNFIIDWGGGICCDAASPNLINNVIADNIALSEGGALYCFNNSYVTVVNTICWANSPLEVSSRSGGTYEIMYSDIRGGWEGLGNIDEDPFFISAYEGDYNVCSQSPCIDAGDPYIIDPDGSRSDIGVYYPDHQICDIGKIVYVSTLGSDDTGNGTAQNPYRTINHSVDEAYSGDTILVANGIYMENVDVTARFIRLFSNYVFSHDTMDIYNTVIDGGSDTTAVTFSNCAGSSAVTGFTIRNGSGWLGGGLSAVYSDILISHNIIEDNISGAVGGGVGCYHGKPVIENNIIRNNMANGGGGVRCYYSKAVIRYNILRNNDAVTGGGLYTSNLDEGSAIHNNIFYMNSGYRGGGYECFGTVAALNNNVFYGNVSTTEGGAVFCHFASPQIINSIFWADSAAIGGDEIRADTASFPVITYCDVQGGWQGIGNIDSDPLFRDPSGGDLHLMAIACGDSVDSPCIDAGHPDSIDIALGCVFGLGGPRADMGAYGGNNGDWITGVSGDESSESETLPEKISLSQNYPNPFNAATTIKFVLPESGNINLTVFDLLGRRVQILIDSYENAGIKSVVFDASKLSSGIYYYSLRAGEATVTKKMLLVK